MEPLHIRWCIIRPEVTSVPGDRVKLRVWFFLTPYGVYIGVAHF